MAGRLRIDDISIGRGTGRTVLFRLAALSLVLLSLTLAVPARAAQGAGTTTPPAADRQIEQLIKTIQNPTTRARFIAALQASAGAEAVAPGHTATAAGVPQLVDSLGAHFLAALSGGIAWFGAVFDAARAELSSPGAAFGTLQAWLLSAEFRSSALSLLVTIAAALALGIAAARLAGWALGGVRRRTAERPGHGFPHRLVGSIVLLVLDLAEIAAFAAVASVMVAVLRPAWVAQVCALALVNAMILVRLGRAAGRFVLAPLHPSLRLVSVGDQSAAYLSVWLRRLLIVAVYGYYALQAALLFGVDPVLYAFVLKLLGLLIAALLAVFLMQNRRAVARLLAPPAGKEASGAWAALRRRVAETWHVFALFYLVAAYMVWVSEVPGGFAYLARAAVLSIVILIVARGITAAVQRALTRLLRINRDLLARSPLVERRANRYVPALRQAVNAAIWVAAAVAMLAAWRVDVGAVFANHAFAQGLQRLAAAAVIVIMALLIWEVTDLAITMYLERKDETGVSLVRSARIRTLLPLIRNAVLVVVSLLAVLTVLSQMGVNIAPLLAGAGVVGLAVGFGSQALVKDVITGAFILFEDTVSVGDVATINGTGGLVEAITIRVIRLRGLDGTVYTIPFGAVTAIANMTKDYSMYLLDIGIAYKENTDRVIEVMREVFADIATDPIYAKDIIGGLEVLGVDRFADSAVYVRARIKTLPIRQWDVGREYNRRMKLKFDALGIEMPFPHRTVYFGQPAAVAAEPAAEPAEPVEEPRRTFTARAG